jgi:large conductance mechanosensitive channel
MLEEFKKFILRGNVVDLAVGVIIGGAFGKIVDSLVKDVIMPPIGVAMGKVDFANLMYVLKEGDKAPGPYATLAKAQEAGAVAIGYGQFLNTVISFLIIGFVLFLIIKSVNKLMPPPPAPDDKRDCPKCFSSIAKKASRCPHCTSEIDAIAT